MKKKKKTQKKVSDWKKWEELAYSYIKDLLGEHGLTFELHTRGSHDGGADGIYLFNRSKNLDASIWCLVLMEAKYRQSESSLSLDDCAKSMIIAFNRRADSLYIVTNIPVSKQAADNAAQTDSCSSLHIIFVSAKDMIQYIDRERKSLSENKKIGGAFLDCVYEQLTNQKSTDSNQIQSMLDNRYVQINSWEKKADETVQKYYLNKNNFYIKGAEGSGKRTLMNLVAKKLERNGVLIKKINLAVCKSIRVLFLHTICSLWNVKAAFLDEKDIEKYIQEILFIPSENMQEGKNIIETAKSVLLQSSTEISKNKDIYMYHLLSYISMLLKTREKPLKIALIFEQIGDVSKDILVFLMKMISDMNDLGIISFVEMNDPFILENDEIYNNSVETKAFIDKFKHEDVFVPDINEDDSVNLIRSRLSLNHGQALSLAKVLDNNPGKITAATDLLNDQYKDKLEIIANYDSEKLIDFWDKIGFYKYGLIPSSVKHFYRMTPFPEIYEITYFCDGYIPLDLISFIYGEDAEKIIDYAIKSGMYYRDTAYLFCRNSSYRKCIVLLVSDENHCYNIVYKIDKYFHNNKSRLSDKVAYLRFLYLKHDVVGSELAGLLIELVHFRMGMHQYSDALQLIREFLDYYDNHDVQTERIVEIYLMSLDCIRELQIDDDPNLSYLYKKTENEIISFCPKEENPDWYRYLLHLWHREFITANTKESIRISRGLMEGLDRSRALFSEAEDFPGQVYTAYGLSVKKIQSGEAALSIFEQGVLHYPKSVYANASFKSQEANLMLSKNSEIALKKYQKLLEYVKDKDYPYHEVLHIENDIAMASFFSGMYKEAAIMAQKVISKATSIELLAQKGRAENILACCAIASVNDIKKAKELLESSIASLSLCRSYQFLWRSQFNLASVHIFSKDEDEALINIRSILDRVNKSFSSKIISDPESTLYQVNLACFMLLKESENIELYSEYYQKQDDSVKKKLAELTNNSDWRSNFVGKIRTFNGIILTVG